MTLIAEWRSIAKERPRLLVTAFYCRKLKMWKTALTFQSTTIEMFSVRDTRNVFAPSFIKITCCDSSHQDLLMFFITSMHDVCSVAKNAVSESSCICDIVHI